MKYWESFQNFGNTLRGIYLTLEIMLNSNFGKYHDLNSPSKLYFALSWLVHV